MARCGCGELFVRNRCQWCWSQGVGDNFQKLPGKQLDNWVSEEHRKRLAWQPGLCWLMDQKWALSRMYNGSRYANPKEPQQQLGVSDFLTVLWKHECRILKTQLMDLLVTQHESVQLRTESGSPNIPMKLFLWRLQSALRRFKVLTSRIIQWWYQFWHDAVPMWPGTSPFRGTLITDI